MTEPKRKDLPDPPPLDKKSEAFSIAKVFAGAYVCVTSFAWTVERVKKFRGR